MKDDPTAHQMDLVFDGLLDRAAEAEGCAGASPRVENTAGVAGRRGPSGGLTEAGRSLGQPRAWCGAERRLRSASWSEAEPASVGPVGASRLVCKSEYDYQVSQ